MRISIRQDTFETNSSSANAIVIKKDIDPWVPFIWKTVDFQDFATRQNIIYYDPEFRLNFLWTAIWFSGLYDDNEIKEWEQRIKSILGSTALLHFSYKFYEDSGAPRGWVQEDEKEITAFLNRMKTDDELLEKFLRGDAYVATYDTNFDWIPSFQKESHEDDRICVFRFG